MFATCGDSQRTFEREENVRLRRDQFSSECAIQRLRRTAIEDSATIDAEILAETGRRTNGPQSVHGRVQRVVATNRRGEQVSALRRN